jgi:hypothetical protein
MLLRSAWSLFQRDALPDSRKPAGEPGSCGFEEPATVPAILCAGLRLGHYSVTNTMVASRRPYRLALAVSVSFATNGDLGSCYRAKRRNARGSSPRMG